MTSCIARLNYVVPVAGHDPANLLRMKQLLYQLSYTEMVIAGSKLPILSLFFNRNFRMLLISLAGCNLPFGFRI